ncbi:MAG: translation initiation factor IF-2 [Clostridia bacterium]|nr:translation initiation factor IF-2 [Clostridia bacterium]
MTNSKTSQATPFENLKTLKSKLLPQICDFNDVLKSAKDQLNNINVAIQNKQKCFDEKRAQQEVAVEKQVDVVVEQINIKVEEPEVKQPAKEEKVSKEETIAETKPQVVEQPQQKAKPVETKKAEIVVDITPSIKEEKPKKEVETPEVSIENQQKTTTAKKQKPVKQQEEVAVAESSVQEKTYTDEKGNIKVRRFISLDNPKFGAPQSKFQNNKGQFTHNNDANADQRKNANHFAQGHKPAQGANKSPYAQNGQQRQLAKQQPVAQKPAYASKPTPAFSTEMLPKQTQTKNYGNKNKTPEKSDEKQRNISKRQLIKRSYQIVDEDEEALLAKRPKSKKQPAPVVQPVIKSIESAVVSTKDVQIKLLSEKTGIPVAQLIKALFKEGIVKTINDTIEYDIASFIAESFNVKLEYKPEKTAEEQMFDAFDVQDEQLPDDEKRPPIVTVMGHVDHGKTSVLDAIRNTNVTAGEAGGITQHIGAYTVKVHGESITFIDTPGHAAFTAMRARGAKITDVAIIVVAADDGVMPQTIEAINHAKAAEVSIIVAINKVDKPESNPDKVKQQLLEFGLVAEEWGGDTIMVPVSAKTGKNLDLLLESILTVTEIKELKANSKKRAIGTVIESKLDKGRGPVATILIKNGTLSIGDYVIAGTVSGKIRAMFDDKGRKVTSAGPSTPVEVLGFEEVPIAGDIMHAGDEKNIKEVASERRAQERENIISSSTNVTLGDLFTKISEGELKTLNIIIKTDVQGSLEALKVSLEKLSNNEVKVSSIHGGVGAVNETDVMLARASNAIIIGFNVRPDAKAKAVAEAEGVDIRLYRIIYDAVDDITKAMKGMLAPKFKEEIVGQVTVRNTFKISGVGVVAGSYVNSGKITKNSRVRLYRDNVLISDCEVAALKRFKDDAKEVVAGFECGVSLVNYNDIKVDDVFEVYVMQQIVD